MENERKRMTSSEVSVLLELLAITGKLNTIIESKSMGIRMQKMKRAKWRLNTARGLLLKMCTEMMNTMPVEQLKHMKRQLKHVKCWTYIGKQIPVKKDEEDGRFLDVNELNTCVEAIRECCQMCSIEDKSKRRQCERAKLLDILPVAVDRNDCDDCGWFETLGSF